VRMRGRIADPEIPIGAPVEAAIRAERLRPLDGDGDPDSCRIEATIVETVFEGDRLVYAARAEALGGVPLQFVDTDPARHGTRALGERVVLGFRPSDLMVFDGREEQRPGRNDREGDA